MSLKTRSEIRAEFANKGMSISSWALQHGFSPSLAIAILNDDDTRPARKCSRGDSHNIAVALRLKEGEIHRTRLVA